jgi:hypothetical protein
VTRLELLRIREERWEPLLRGVSLVAEAEIRERHRTQAALALGGEYGRRRFTTDDSGIDFLTRWPACLVAAMTGVAVTSYAQGTYWPALWKAAGYKGDTDDQRIWGNAFADALQDLGLPNFSNSHLRYVGPVLMHAGIPAYCLGDFFRLLLERRRQDPGLDADSFLAWATASGRGLRLSMLDKPAQRFLLSGGDYAHDVVDRTLDLLDRLAEPDPDFDAVGLPGYMVETAKSELAAGHLDVARPARSAGGRSHASTRRQMQPRIVLDPYGQGVHVVLPAVGETPDGVARWRVTADGETATVQSRAMWVGAAETTPETTFTLNRPVRSVAVSLSGREDLAAELTVVDPADPVIFFGDDGRRLSGAVSLPRTHVWIMHPTGRDLEFAGDAGQVGDPAVPLGWDGWRLRHLSLNGVQSVSLGSGRSHPVEVQARPTLLLGEPVPGASTPFGSPVYSMLPRLELPRVAGAEIKWYAEIRRVGAAAPIVGRAIEADDQPDIWEEVPRPVLGAFEVTVRGPLGRGLRRTIFVAEGLSVTYTPRVRLLTGTGLASGKAILTSGVGAIVRPTSLHFGPNERACPVEYRAADESEPVIITPPHAIVMCQGAGVTTWTTSVLHLVSEDFAEAGRLLVRIPGQHSSELELAVHVRGEQVQTIPASGQQSAGLVGFDLSRAADTIAAAGRSELTISVGGKIMPVARIRPRRLATGAEMVDGKLVLRDAATVDGLVVGVYSVYAPWRTPTELEVAADGTAALPDELQDAGPLRILPRIEDPWIVSNWPMWPGADAYTCVATGVPVSPDDQEEEALSRFVAAEGEIPELTKHLGLLWRLVALAPELVEAGARIDLAVACRRGLRVHERAALLALADEELSQPDVVHALITTGLAASMPEETPWTSHDKRFLERLWAGLPAAAALATCGLFEDDVIVDAATLQCGDSLTEIFKGHPDPYAAVGKFGPEARMFDRWEPEQIDAVWQAAAIVPQTLLDADTRLTAARQLFDARYKQPMRAATVDAKKAVGVAEWLVKASAHPDLAHAITERQPPNDKGGWLALPAISIAMALIARLAARGNSSCETLERDYRGKWANLALYAPDLVAIDLVRAEALVSAAFKDERHTPEDPE